MLKASRGKRAVAALAAALSAALIAAPSAPVAAQRAAGESMIERGFLVGRWTDSANCGAAVSFQRDGRFVAADGGAGIWHFQNGRLTLTGTSTLHLGIVPIDRDTVAVINPDGRRGRSVRCGGGESGGQLPLDGTALDRAYIVGRWTDSDDCGNAVAFGRDGRFVTSGNAAGQWVLRGDRLTLTGDSALTLQIVVVDGDRMIVVNPDGALGRSTRC